MVSSSSPKGTTVMKVVSNESVRYRRPDSLGYQRTAKWLQMSFDHISLELKPN